MQEFEGEPEVRLASWRYHALRIIVGCFLLAAAALKIHDLFFASSSQGTLVGSPRLVFALIQIEVFLGLWLLSGWAKQLAWLIALGFFAVLACFSLYLALEEQPSCGCFGQFKVSPWLTFALDVVALLTLTCIRPNPITLNTLIHPAISPKSLLQVIGGAVVLLFVFLSSFMLLSGNNPAETLALLRGESLSVTPLVADVGAGHSGDWADFQIELTNHSDKAIRIVGGTTDCNCVSTSDLPAVVAPGTSQFITIVCASKGPLDDLPISLFCILIALNMP
jgi:hypothetical protein